MEGQLTSEGVNKRYHESSYVKILGSVGFRLGWIQGLRSFSFSAPPLTLGVDFRRLFPSHPHEEGLCSSRLVFKATTVMWTGVRLLRL